MLTTVSGALGPLADATRSVSLMLCVAVTGAACAERPSEGARAADPEARVATQEWILSADARIRTLSPGVWMHTTWAVVEGGDRYLSNGLIVLDDDGLGVTLIDGGWGEQRTAEVLDWIEAELSLPVTQALITHFHDDRLSGAPVLAARSIPMRGLALTAELARDHGVPLPEAIPGLGLGDAIVSGPVEVLFPGAGHTRDNIVVWVPEQRILFGGCAVRPGESAGMGNTADGDVAAWPDAIRSMQNSFPTAEVVIPSHGEPGGPELLEHTLGLLEAELDARPD